MGFGLFLLDSETSNINKLDQKKRLRLDKLDKVFFDLQVVPLFGDMQIAPFNYVKSSKTFDPSRWPLSSSSAISPQVSICTVYCIVMRSSRIRGLDLAEWLERLAVNGDVATVLGSIPASSDTVESEGRQMKQC
jgi:hypothetical protein